MGSGSSIPVNCVCLDRTGGADGKENARLANAPAAQQGSAHRVQQASKQRQALRANLQNLRKQTLEQLEKTYGKAHDGESNYRRKRVSH